MSLAWDLPLIPETWETGLRIRTLGFQGWLHDSAALRPSLPQLERLVCRSIGLRSLDLSQVPGLTKLECAWNHLTALDLAPVPGLTKLNCDEGVRVLNAPPGLEIWNGYDCWGQNKGKTRRRSF